MKFQLALFFTVLSSIASAEGTLYSGQIDGFKYRRCLRRNCTMLVSDRADLSSDGTSMAFTNLKVYRQGNESHEFSSEDARLDVKSDRLYIRDYPSPRGSVLDLRSGALISY